VSRPTVCVVYILLHTNNPPLESTQITPENKKDAEEDPTPSIWEDPPIGDENDSAGGDIFSENPDDANLRQT